MSYKDSSRQNVNRKSRPDNNIRLSGKISAVQAKKASSSAKQDKPKKKAPGGIRAIRIMTAASIIAASMVLGSLYKIQILDHDSFVSAGASQQYIMQEILPKRGEIFDNNGILLASSSIKYSIGITPEHVRSLSRKVTSEEIAEYVALTLDLPLEKISSYLEQKDKSYIQLVKSVPEEIAESLRNWLSNNRVGGFTFDQKAERLYTNGDLAGQVIGFSRFENKKLYGVLGLESYYDETLSGKAGYSYARRDNYRNHGTVPFSIPTDQAAVNGSDLYLHLDLKMQEALQHELEQLAGLSGLSSGVSGIIMDVNSGAILAMGQIPTMQSLNPTAIPGGIDKKSWNSDLNKAITQLSSGVWRNTNVSDVFEPGSTMKGITAAIALEEDAVEEDSEFLDDPIDVMSHTIYCVHREGHGLETVKDAFVNSCNPVFVQIGQRIDLSLFYDYIAAFGLMEKTGIDLPAESNSIFHKQPSILDFANLTFGESVAVTPVHMARAYAALVNGGYLINPSLVKEFVNADGVVENPNEDKAVQILSGKTSARIKELLKASGNEKLKWTFSCAGYDVLGKTGTSTDEIDKQNTYSFIAIGPEDQSDLLCMLVVRKPVTEFSGSAVVARHTKRLLGKAMDIRGYERSLDSNSALLLSKNVELPDISQLTFSEAAYALAELDLFAFRADADIHYDDYVSYLGLKPNSSVAVGSTIWLKSEASEQEMVHVPDFSGLDYHSCIWLAEKSGVVLRVHGQVGNASVTAQKPQPTRLGTNNEDADAIGAPALQSEEIENYEGQVGKGSIVEIWFGEP